MATVTGYLIILDTGAVGPSVGDDLSGGGATTSFDTSSYDPLGTGVVNYPATVGDADGKFYDIGGNYYFVPDDSTGFPTGEIGELSSFSDAIYGTTGSETIFGTSDGELIHDTDDDLYNPTGSDYVSAGGGDDTVYFGDGDDTVYGGSGDDSIGSWATGSGNNTLSGDAGDDTIIGGWGDDDIYGGTGSDWLSGASGTDVIYGGDDSDQIWVTDDHGSVKAIGGEGGVDWDILGFGNYSTSQGVEVTFSGDETGSYDFIGSATSGDFSEIEEIISTEFDDTIDGSATSQDMLVYALDGADSVTGGSGADRLYVGAGDDVVDGGAGNDEIYGDAGDDSLTGGAGDDTLYGNDGGDTFSGGAGTDTLDGGDGNDRFLIEDDDDTSSISGGGWWDTIEFLNSSTTQGVTVTYTGDESGTFSFDGSTADGDFTDIEELFGTWNYGDTIDASADSYGIKVYSFGGDDTVTGGTGNDRIYLNDGDDTGIGGAGDDQLFGEGGADVLTGGAGDDTLTGGSGDDVYVFEDGSGSDTIADFDIGDSNADGSTNDQLDVTALTDNDGNPVDIDDVVVSDNGSGSAVLTFPNGESITLKGVDPASITPSALMSMGVPCFTSGTLIRTPSGDCPVESLRPGDLVTTVDHGAQPLLWCGQTHLPHHKLIAHPKVRPILIAHGALGNTRDLLVSRQHGMVLPRGNNDEYLVRAIHLARTGGPGFRIANGVRQVTYVHLLFRQHEIVFAENAQSESFYPGSIGLAMLSVENRAAVFQILPELMLGAEGLAAYGPTARPVLNDTSLGRQVAQSFEKIMTT